jgi:hypothetical protein
VSFFGKLNIFYLHTVFFHCVFFPAYDVASALSVLYIFQLVNVLVLRFFLVLELTDLSFSPLQSYLEDSINNPSKKQEMLGDSVAWAGCTIMYLLGQQQHFELFDFSYQFLNVAEVESATVSHYQSSERTKSSNFLQVRYFSLYLCWELLYCYYR